MSEFDAHVVLGDEWETEVRVNLVEEVEVVGVDCRVLVVRWVGEVVE